MHLHRLDGSVERLGNVEVAQSGLPLVEAELLGLRQGRGGQIVPRIEQGDAPAGAERRHGVQVCALLRDRTSVGWGESVSVRLYLVVRRIIKKTNKPDSI